MTRFDVFVKLRDLVLASGSRSGKFSARPDLIPIEGTVDGGYYLRSDLRVVHLDSLGETGNEEVQSVRRSTAMVGTLVRDFPLATALIPVDESVQVCSGCGGTGNVRGLPSDLGHLIRCECGGLGWISEVDA